MQIIKSLKSMSFAAFFALFFESHCRYSSKTYTVRNQKTILTYLKSTADSGDSEKNPR